MSGMIPTYPPGAGSGGRAGSTAPIDRSGDSFPFTVDLAARGDANTAETFVVKVPGGAPTDEVTIAPPVYSSSSSAFYLAVIAADTAGPMPGIVSGSVLGSDAINLGLYDPAGGYIILRYIPIDLGITQGWMCVAIGGILA